MISNKQSVQDFITILEAKEIQDIIISPGSRNAALTLSLVHHKSFQTYSIPDERSAAFVALGMIQQTKKPTAVICTSGSAVLNYAPAVSEAYYQNLPLIVISADRPLEWIDQQDGQTIRQQGALSNHVTYEAQLLSDPTTADQLWYNQRITNEALNATIQDKKPVHINFPFTEPLYQSEEKGFSTAKSIQLVQTESTLSESQINELRDIWNHSENRVLLVGQSSPNSDLEQNILKLAKSQSITILSETTSNVNGDFIIPCIDRFLSSKNAQLEVDLLLTIGDAIVSKKIKQYFRQNRPSYHWHIHTQSPAPDTYQSLTHHIPVSAHYFLDKMLESFHLEHKKSVVFNNQLNKHLEHKASDFAQAAPFSDLSVFHFIKNALNQTPQVIHLANSSAIRYAQLFNWHTSHLFYCNRGTSGIDGSTSTSLGYALKSKNEVIFITGDISFFYDSNAFFNHHIPPNLKVVLINNKGGNIFKIIPGPKTTKLSESYFETQHEHNALKLADMFGLDYSSAESMEELHEHWAGFIHVKKAAVLEIRTKPEENPKVLDGFFEFMNTQNRTSL